MGGSIFQGDHLIIRPRPRWLHGSITSFYTILADGDDNNDPVVDAARAILDGHIVLSRLNAQMGIYPAVDVSNSISRVMNELISDNHLNASTLFRKHISTYIENKDLLLKRNVRK